jgi:hypothetical protein
MTSGAPVPADPERFRKHPPGPQGPEPENLDVGEFRQGSPLSQWALARYLVGRAITESMGWSLLVVGVVLLVLSALVWLGLHSALLGVLVLIVALGVLLLRALLLGVVRRLTGFRQYAPIEERMKSLVDDTRSDVLRELRRIGLPGRMWTLPLLAIRFLGRNRRRDTLERLKQFEISRAVPRSRLDEMHLLIRSAVGAPPQR